MNVGAERSSSRRPRISTSILSLFGGACTITDETSARMRRIARRRRRVRAVATKQCGQVVEVGAVALQRSWMQSDEFVGDIDFGKLKVNVGALRLQPLDVARDRVRIDLALMIASISRRSSRSISLLRRSNLLRWLPASRARRLRSSL